MGGSPHDHQRAIRTSIHITCIKDGRRTCMNKIPRLKISLCRVGIGGLISVKGSSSGAEYLTFFGFMLVVVNPASWGITETPKSAILACPSSETNMFSFVSESANAVYGQKKVYVPV